MFRVWNNYLWVMPTVPPLSTLGRFFLKAKTAYSSQSPFLFHWHQKVLKAKPPTDNKGWRMLVECLQKARQDTTEVLRTDHGATSYHNRPQTIGHIAKSQVSSTDELAILFHSSQYVRPKCILELGTSLGFSAAALSLGYPSCKVETVEGDPAIAQWAKENHTSLDFGNIILHECTIADYLESKSKHCDLIDLLYMDGHHDGHATITYFNKLLPFFSEKTVVIVDDILWSRDMHQAWEQLRKNPRVRASLAYERIGFLFFSQAFVQSVHEDWVRTTFKPWTIWSSW